ncbi:NAD(P)/FAD-dependent oxidoreductase [Burkholderiaceae bacterium]|jgi:sulfide dehydrogenase [flavocytochrome c] flavoprotein chain|nr:NAD(P)/FAD-dependent oxidoreductase [Betaproteobacteria bacterium]MCH9846901.1 NAD(P)/FAD-dependent oxidoreductase [Betaproteobacteria bacterium]MDA8533796.1 NAD(P)/FAD-dependent oxidoreductase [Burkholderiaceae bacterium]MDC0113261.1 NAD(P)/FAD-dependent oxidoreductase [Burkholderiaceae bacterium]
MSLNRRFFLSLAAGTTAALAAPAIIGMAKPRVIVIGGGAGGATAARYIAKDSKGAIDVTLVEPSRTYYTCFFSNLYLGGVRTMESLAHSYGKLASENGINVVHDWAVGIDRDARTVTLAGGHKLGYDRLILSPGIDFVDGAVPGWDTSKQNKMPHAYKAGSQTELLKAQIEAMPQGGTFAMVAPPNPYRCPPGPYERVSMVAHLLKEKNPTAKILVADPKPKFSKEALFREAWSKHYDGMIDWIGSEFGGGNVSVDADAMMLNIDGEAVKVDVCNVIPAMKAGRICQIAGITEGNWAPVTGHTMQSRMDENIYVLGDATSQGDMPKSGYSANSQAKVAAMAVRAALTGSRMFPAKFSNTCWSMVGTDDGVKVGASYEATDEKIAKVSGFISKPGENAALRKATFEESLGWYAGITTDMFG